MSREELREQLKNLSEDDLLMELIRDISEELDIDTLCHKILVNVCLLTNSDRGSLFLARGSRDNRYLVPKLFDVTPQSILEDAIHAAEQYSKISPIPFGRGIAGHVAQHKDSVNLKNAYEVRFVYIYSSAMFAIFISLSLFLFHLLLIMHDFGYWQHSFID